MSCRVLKRGMENFTLNTLVDYARSNGFKRIIGEYLPSAKNQMVEGIIPTLDSVKSKVGIMLLNMCSTWRRMKRRNVI